MKTIKPIRDEKKILLQKCSYILAILVYIYSISATYYVVKWSCFASENMDSCATTRRERVLNESTMPQAIMLADIKVTNALSATLPFPV